MTPQGYAHWDPEVYMDQDSGYKRCNGSGEDQTCSAQWDFNVVNAIDHLWLWNKRCCCNNATATYEEE